MPCQLPIAADTATRSRKSDAAKKFGIPIAPLQDFIAALSTDQPLDVVKFEKAGVALVCVKCGYSWVASRRSAQPICAGCKAE